MAIVYCAVVKRKKKARKEIIWLNVFTGKFCKQFLSEEGSLFLTV
jgi:hypothetical protein